MGRITIKDLEVYAKHGCFDEEKIIGANYQIDIWIEGDFTNAHKTDRLSDAVDYVTVADIAREEMMFSSNLIEHVANRILERLLVNWKNIEMAGVKIRKLSPPMNTKVYAVEYDLEKRR